MVDAIPGARLLIVPGGHGDYLGEQAASGGDRRKMHATVPFLQRFLGDLPSGRHGETPHLPAGCGIVSREWRFSIA